MTIHFYQATQESPALPAMMALKSIVGSAAGRRTIDVTIGSESGSYAYQPQGAARKALGKDFGELSKRADESNPYELVSTCGHIAFRETPVNECTVYAGQTDSAPAEADEPAPEPKAKRTPKYILWAVWFFAGDRWHRRPEAYTTTAGLRTWLATKNAGYDYCGNSRNRPRWIGYPTAPKR